MSLKLRLFLGLAALVALLVLAQAWWVRGLTRELSEEVGDVALEVGHSVVSRLHVEAHAGQEQDGTEAYVFKSYDSESNRAESNRAESHGTESHVEHEESAAGQAEVRVERRRIADGGAVIEIVVDHREEEDTETERDFQWFFFDDSDREANSFLELKGAGLHERIPIPRQGLRLKIERYERRLLLGALGFLGLGLLLAGLVAQRIAAPLERLAAAARRVGKGELGTRVEAEAPAEVGAALLAFNQMSGRLADLDRRHRALVARRHLGEIGEIARGLAHSLRNPLNALGLSVDELAGRAADEESEEIALAARRQIRRIDGAIRSFLVLASHGEGQTGAGHGVAVEEIALDELARDVVLEAIQDHRQSTPRIEVEADDALPMLTAAPAELRAVIQALVVNAVEASPAGGKVAVRITESANGLRLVVEDEGPGLAAAVRERLFTPHLTTKPNGAGMGLFLAHRIATGRYGGSLSLEARPEGGTRAVLDLAPRGGEDEDA